VRRLFTHAWHIDLVTSAIALSPISAMSARIAALSRRCVPRAFLGVYVRRYVSSHCLTVVMFFHPYFADRMSFSISTARRFAASRLSLENPVEIR
jgi:hypothetical protein